MAREITRPAESERPGEPREEEAMPAYLKPLTDPAQMLRIVEALLFASDKPLAEEEIAEALPEGADVAALLEELQARHADSGVRLARVAGKWQMRTADDLRYLLRKEVKEEKKLSRVALETLAIIAYHQPVTRADIEDIRGVATSKGTLDKLMEIGWVKIRGRRRVPGRPVTYGVTEEFLTHFGLDSVRDLPGLAELKGAGLLDADLPPGFEMPQPQGQAGAESLPSLDEDDALFDAAADDQDDAEPPLDMHLPDGPGEARKP